MMMFYTVRKPTSDVPYLDRSGHGSLEAVPMTEIEADRVATQGGGVVQVWRAELEREYPVSAAPELPWLEIIG